MHCVSAEAPDTLEDRPAGHASQESPVAPTESLYLPELQAVHSPAPSLLQRPAEQVLQDVTDVAPAILDAFPAKQGMQISWEAPPTAPPHLPVWHSKQDPSLVDPSWSVHLPFPQAMQLRTPWASVRFDHRPPGHFWHMTES